MKKPFLNSPARRIHLPSQVPAAISQRISHTLSPENLDQLGKRTAQSTASRQAERLLLSKALNSTSTPARVHWLRAAADELHANIDRANIGACHAGCGSCCHIHVLITQSEARLIADEIGLKLRTPKSTIPLHISSTPGSSADSQRQRTMHHWASHYKGLPCVFFKPRASSTEPQHANDPGPGTTDTPAHPRGTCSIYAQRPLACRLHRNLDTDNLLCQLLANDDPPAPYLDVGHHRQIRSELFANEPAADIREWFGQQILNGD